LVYGSTNWPISPAIGLLVYGSMGVVGDDDDIVSDGDSNGEVQMLMMIQ
jgi:hypothetical protein